MIALIGIVSSAIQHVSSAWCALSKVPVNFYFSKNLSRDVESQIDRANVRGLFGQLQVALRPAPAIHAIVFSSLT